MLNRLNREYVNYRFKEEPAMNLKPLSDRVILKALEAEEQDRKSVV